MQYHLSHCPPNPTLEYADSIELPKGTTEIISQGGGSTIDVGKWLARKFHVKHTAIPTTAGTGSEVTRFCVLTVKGKKKTFKDKKFIPDSYVLDPRLVVSLPELHTLSSGLDAYSQALESLWSKNATPESRTYSQMAINIICTNLEKSLMFPENENYRMNMLLGANFSGRAINLTKTNVCHAISYPLTELYNIPHGIACAMSLKFFTKKFLGIDLDLPELPTYTIDKQKVARIAIKSKKLKDCPVKVSLEDIIKSL